MIEKTDVNMKGYLVVGTVFLVIVGLIGCESLDRDRPVDVTVPGEVSTVSNFIMSNPELAEWGAQYVEGNTYAMVNIPVWGALKVEYGIKNGGMFAIFLETTTGVELEIGLVTRESAETVQSQVDVLDWVCVTYDEGGMFASTPANSAPKVQGDWMHYQRKDEVSSAVYPWWPSDAGFTFSAETQTVCVIQNSTLIVAEVPGPFPKPQPTETSGIARPTRIVIFVTANWTRGDIGGRAGADAFCQGDPNNPGTFANVKALLSVSPMDQMRDVLPAAYQAGIPVQRLDGTPIDTDWNALWDASGPATAVGAGSGVWTGSSSNGLAALSCVGWTTAALSENGIVGAGGSSGAVAWAGMATICFNPWPLYCAAW